MRHEIQRDSDMAHGHFLNSTGRHGHFLNSTGRHWAFLKLTRKIRTPPSRAPILILSKQCPIIALFVFSTKIGFPVFPKVFLNLSVYHAMVIFLRVVFFYEQLVAKFKNSPFINFWQKKVNSYNFKFIYMHLSASQCKCIN